MRFTISHQRATEKETQMNDHRPTEFYRPKSIESVLLCIDYRKKMAEHVDVQIVIMTELMEDICTRLKALEAAAHD